MCVWGVCIVCMYGVWMLLYVGYVCMCVGCVCMGCGCMVCVYGVCVYGVYMCVFHVCACVYMYVGIYVSGNLF